VYVVEHDAKAAAIVHADEHTKLGRARSRLPHKWQQSR
jgi:hypothetical protein